MKQLQCSYQHQLWLTVKGYILLYPLIKVFIKVEETKFFAELAIAISFHLDNLASEIQIFDLSLLDELSSFMESGLGSLEEFYESKANEILSLQKKINLFFSSYLFILKLCTVIKLLFNLLLLRCKTR